MKIIEITLKTLIHIYTWRFLVLKMYDFFKRSFVMNQMLSKKGLLCFFPKWFFYVICNLACSGAWGWLFLWELKHFKFSVVCFWIFDFFFNQMENSLKEQFYFRCIRWMFTVFFSTCGLWFSLSEDWLCRLFL